MKEVQGLTSDNDYLTSLPMTMGAALLHHGNKLAHCSGAQHAPSKGAFPGVRPMAGATCQGGKAPPYLPGVGILAFAAQYCRGRGPSIVSRTLNVNLSSLERGRPAPLPGPCWAILAHA